MKTQKKHKYRICLALLLLVGFLLIPTFSLIGNLLAFPSSFFLIMSFIPKEWIDDLNKENLKQCGN